MNKILVTGASGFIGFHLCKKLIEQKDALVFGLDNLSDYYDVDLKYNRLEELGIGKEAKKGEIVSSSKYPNFEFIKLDLKDKESLSRIFKTHNFDIVCNLAAQAGVRYSIDNPSAFIESNLVGFANLIEESRNNDIKHFIYASSSSVYGLNKEVPFAENQKTDTPVSLYAATKKANELMAHSYSHLFKMNTTGLRFFTVYGPWGRPDMATFLFTKAILENKPLKVFNYGEMYRDFTYIDDIIEGVVAVVNQTNTDRKEYYKLYNIGNNKPINISEFLNEIEKQLGIKAKKELLPIQQGDVEKTWADISELKKEYSYAPKTDFKEGISNFLKWYKEYVKK